jgi:hypothetical protein
MQVQQLFSNIVAKNNHGQAKMYSPDLSLWDRPLGSIALCSSI